MKSFRHLKNLKRPFKILAIETSCDDTAVAIIDSDKRILGESVVSQYSLHAPSQGIIPYLATEFHRKALPDVIKSTLAKSHLEIQDIDVFAATRGPGLAGSLSVGFEAGKLLAKEGHALMARMNHKIGFPFLCLLISGGHTLLLLAKEIGNYIQWGTTLDDSVGEAIDKAARMIQLPYDQVRGPAAAFVELACLGQGSPTLFNVPKSNYIRNSMNFSFSGIKTSLKKYLDDTFGANIPKEPQLLAEIAKAFLDCCALHIADRIKIALGVDGSIVDKIVISGGAARNEIQDEICSFGRTIVRPNPIHCTDNALMIAWTAFEYINSNKNITDFDNVLQEWPLQDLKFDILTEDIPSTSASKSSH